MNPLTITFVTACTALVAATAGPFITFRIGKAQINANVLSTNRQRWIENFRELIASFCSQAATATYMRDRILESGRIVISQDPELARRVENLVMTLTKIKLMINPREVDHQRLVELLVSAMTMLRNAPLNANIEADLEAIVDKIVAETQSILKREWNRVKKVE